MTKGPFFVTAALTLSRGHVGRKYHNLPRLSPGTHFLESSFISRKVCQTSVPTYDAGDTLNVRQEYPFVRNYSSKQLSSVELQVLTKGLNFNISSNRLQAEVVIPRVEPALRRLSGGEVNVIRSRIANILESQQSGLSNLTQLERKALYKLSRDHSIQIIRDANMGLVVLDKDDYRKRILEHLSAGPYLPVTNKRSDQLIKKCRREVVDYITMIRTKLGNALWRNLYPKSTVLPTFYGVPTTHILDLTMTPSVHAAGSPCHKLAVFLAKIINPRSKDRRSEFSSLCQFVGQTQYVTANENYVIGRLLITLLSEQFERTDILNIVRRHLSSESDLASRTDLSVDEVIQGLSVCLTMRNFVFDGVSYRQTGGLPIKQPLSSVLTDLVMQEFKRNLVQVNSKTSILWRRLNEALIVLPSTSFPSLLHHLTEIKGDNKIKFTVENEVNGKLAFSGCQVTRMRDGELKTSVSKVMMDSQRIVPFSSEHPRWEFLNISASALKQAISSGCLEIIAHVMKQLLCHGYPMNLLSCQVKRITSRNKHTGRRWVTTVVLPYKRGTSESIQKVLNAYDIRVNFEYENSIGKMLLHRGENISPGKTHNCVYQVNCSDCNAVYIGETDREVQTRMDEHKRCTKRVVREQTEFQNKCQIHQSALASHVLETGHDLNFNGVKVIRTGFRSRQERLIAEAIEIQRQGMVMNRSDGKPLNEIWRSVLKFT